MRDYNLGFISNEDIYNHVKQTVVSYRREINLDQFNENIVDPIKLTFDSKVYGKTIKEAIEDERFRQIDKSNSNRIGYFHQNIFRCAGNGWVVPKEGFDVENDERHIYVKLINQYSSLNISDLRKCYIKMQSKIIDDNKAECYLVEILSQNSKNEPWQLKSNKMFLEHKCIRRISIDQFYALVFSDIKAFYKLCIALPQIIEDVVTDDDALSMKNTVYEELTHKQSDLLASLYLQSFSTYEGFDALLYA